MADELWLLEWYHRRWYLFSLSEVTRLSVVVAVEGNSDRIKFSASTAPPALSTTAANPFISNGRRIYFTATGQRGVSITYALGGTGMMAGWMMGGATLACVNGHSCDGRGRHVRSRLMSDRIREILVRYRGKNPSVRRRN